MSFKYSQHDGYDKFRATDANDKTTHSGKATYNDDGSLKRLDAISPSSNSNEKHHHEWLYQDKDGSYKYGHGEHDNH